MTAKRKILITAGLPYSNGRLHVGHIAGAYLPADISTRYYRLQGHDVRYVCGSDDHGVAIMISAEKEGKSPAEIAKFFHQKQKEDFIGMNILFDVFGSTSQTEFHEPLSQEFFKTINDKGYFSKESSKQFYDEDKKMFLADRYVKGTCGYCNTEDQNGDQCENCGKLLDASTLKNPKSSLTGNPAIVKETIHWFLDLSQFQDQVSQWLDRSDVRDNTKSFVKQLVSTGLVKRSMTRDISWGIPVPLDDPDAKNKVLYVWFDAPIGYISNTMQMEKKMGHSPEDFQKWWKNDDAEIYHFVGEDNTIFHCVIWIAMLAAEGTYQLPRGVVVNHFLNIQFPDKDVEKISKSRGSAVWIGDYIEQSQNPDVLRYYLTAIAPESARTVYKPEDLIQRNNAELVNTLGNFINRILTFNQKHVGDFVPEIDSSLEDEFDKELEKNKMIAIQNTTDLLEKHSTRGALMEIMNFCRHCNKYIDDKKPWVTRKTDMNITLVTLNKSIQAMRTLAVLLAPFIPKSSEKLHQMLGLDFSQTKWSDANQLLSAHHRLGTPEILFEKLEG